MATDIPTFERASYQRAARTILTNPLITDVYPDTAALPLVRRWAGPLAEDLAELFDYRLELTAATARLVRTLDELDATSPALTATDRVFDRRRYAYLALAIAVLGRSGVQTALSELADRVAGEAGRVDGLELSAERAPDRAAFVDAVAWLAERGALRLADGSARRWADDPSVGEALYDIDRDVVRAIFRPTRVLQHVRRVKALLSRSAAVSRDSLRAENAQRVRRALVERPVVYYDELEAPARNSLRASNAVPEVEKFTGLVAERRAEGVALLDTSGGFSDRRFPGVGTVPHVALLLLNVMADRVLDLDASPLARHTAPQPPGVSLAEKLDLALPTATVLGSLSEDAAQPASAPEENSDPGATYPLIEDSWLATTMSELVETYGSAFAASMRADPDRLLADAVSLLEELKMVVRVDGGVLAKPLLARYRNAAVRVRRRDNAVEVLF